MINKKSYIFIYNIVHLMDEEIEDINIKLKDNTDIIVKEK